MSVIRGGLQHAQPPFELERRSAAPQELATPDQSARLTCASAAPGAATATRQHRRRNTGAAHRRRNTGAAHRRGNTAAATPPQ
jgi:hypothetical protein